MKGWEVRRDAEAGGQEVEGEMDGSLQILEGFYILGGPGGVYRPLGSN